MSLKELENAALGPYKWRSVAARLCPDAQELPAHSHMFSPMTSASSAADDGEPGEEDDYDLRSVFLVPGGRYLLTFAWRWIAVSIALGIAAQVVLLVGDANARRMSIQWLAKPDVYARTMGWRSLGEEVDLARERRDRGRQGSDPHARFATHCPCDGLRPQHLTARC